MNTRKSVIVIGGGIAGLAAARELAGNLCSVTLLEAKERCGGRIHTIRDHSFPVELGAEFVHGESPSLIKTIREAGMPTLEVPDRNQLFADGKVSDVDLWGAVGEVLGRIDPQKPDCSCEEFLSKSAAEPEKTYTRNFVQGFHAADPNRISAHALWRAERASEEINGSSSLWLTRGYGGLVDFLEREIEQAGGEIKRNMAVQKIRWRPGAVEVFAEERTDGILPPAPKEFDSGPRPAILPVGGIREFAADAAIVALPLGILKRDEVQFNPPLPQKLEAARKMEIGNVIKVTFVFRKLLWDDFGFIHAFGEAIPTWWSDARGPTLVGWAGGPKADALLNLFPAQLEELGLKILGHIFPDRAAELRKNFLSSHYWNWADDPHIRGAYSYIPVGGLNLPGQLAAPVEGTLFFAGEATVSDAQTGTVFGALETGLRAAREILRARTP